MARVSLIFLIMAYLVPMLIVFPGHQGTSIAIILTALIGFIISQFVVYEIIKKRRWVDYSNSFTTSVKIIFLVAIVYLIARFSYIVEIIEHIFLGDYFEWALNNAVLRYKGEIRGGVLTKISTIAFISYSALLGGYISNQPKYKTLLLTILIAMIFIESSSLARATVIMALLAFMVEYIIRNNLFFMTASWKRLGNFLLIIFLFLLIISMFSAYNRLSPGDDISQLLINKFSEYSLGMYDALLIWLDSTDISDYGDGGFFYSFASFYKIFGVDVPAGFYTAVETKFGLTNIFLNVKGLLLDFGIFGLAIFFILSGFLLTYWSVKRMQWLGYMFLRSVLFMLLYVPYSPFIFSTVFIGFQLAGVIFGLFSINKIRLPNSSKYNFGKVK